MPNLLAYGDNLDILRRHVADESVDLVYLDPPFNSNADYNVLFSDHGEQAPAQVRAFQDTWTWDTNARRAYEQVVEQGGPIADTMRAFRTMIGRSDMLAYLAMMAPRLVELRRVLRRTGSLFLHCDPTASHYLKLLLDAIFGARAFRNEIVWCYTGPGSKRQRQFSRKHDVILWYSNSDTWTWNPDAVRIPYSAKTKDNYRDGLVGSGFAAGNAAQERQLSAKGKIPEDWWPIAIAPRGREYLGYPTQKPLKLLHRIIAAASNPGDVILDPFCGCGTTVDAAHELGRRWVGIDITHLATGLIKHRLDEAYGPDVTDTYRVIGEPDTEDGARALARDDPFQFQAWALGLVGARVAGSDKKGGDKGIDGRKYFHEHAGGPSRQIVISVKSGRLNPAFVRELRAVVSREDAAIGSLISLEEPTRGMREEAADAGDYVSPGGVVPRLQLRTVAELLGGRGLDYPTLADAAETLWDPETIPTIPKPKHSTRRAKPSRSPRRATQTPVPEHPRAGELRAALADLPDPRQEVNSEGVVHGAQIGDD